MGSVRGGLAEAVYAGVRSEDIWEGQAKRRYAAWRMAESYLAASIQLCCWRPHRLRTRLQKVSFGGSRCR